MIRTLITAFLITLACVPVAGAQAPPSGPYGATVSIAQASAMPDASATLRPGVRYVLPARCNAHPAIGTRFTETSAYTRTGGALGGQHRHGTRVAWHGVCGAVTYDRVTGVWRNGTARTVIVAGWCS